MIVSTVDYQTPTRYQYHHGNQDGWQAKYKKTKLPYTFVHEETAPTGTAQMSDVEMMRSVPLLSTH